MHTSSQQSSASVSVRVCLSFLGPQCNTDLVLIWLKKKNRFTMCGPWWVFRFEAVSALPLRSVVAFSPHQLEWRLNSLCMLIVCFDCGGSSLKVASKPPPHRFQHRTTPKNVLCASGSVHDSSTETGPRGRNLTSPLSVDHFTMESSSWADWSSPLGSKPRAKRSELQLAPLAASTNVCARNLQSGMSKWWDLRNPTLGERCVDHLFAQWADVIP